MKPLPAPKHLERVRAKIQPIVHNIHRGYAIDSEHLRVKILPDKRIQFFLKPHIRSLFTRSR